MYSRTVNAGKSKHNEDQSCVFTGHLTRSVKKTIDKDNRNQIKNIPGTAISKPTAQVRPQPVLSDPTSPHVSLSADQGTPDPLSPASHDLQQKDTNDHIEKNQTDIDYISDEATETDKLTPSLSEDGDLHTPDVNGVQSDGEQSSSPNFCTPLTREKLFVDDGKGSVEVTVPYYYFAVFDGHAGWGAAVYASLHLHEFITSSLSKVAQNILPDSNDVNSNIPVWQQQPKAEVSSVVVGALEQAFWLMDNKVEQDRHRLGITGGCTACIALFILGKLYVANAGDSRATLCLHEASRPMSYDFTPETENYRIRKFGSQHTELMGGEYNAVEFFRRPLRREIGSEALCRHPYMARGWVYKKITEEDMKCPLVSGSGKRSRVMATIGVTRGFGDHDLKAQCTNILIKPFLSCEPEVRIFDLSSETLSDTDVLILATDGLWDITSNEKAVSTLVRSMSRSLQHLPSSDPSRHKYRYTSAAQDLVMTARGKLTDHNWRTNENKPATIDDITVFIVPLKPYQEEHDRWQQMYTQALTVETSPITVIRQNSSPPTTVAAISAASSELAVSEPVLLSSADECLLADNIDNSDGCNGDSDMVESLMDHQNDTSKVSAVPSEHVPTLPVSTSDSITVPLSAPMENHFDVDSTNGLDDLS